MKYVIFLLSLLMLSNVWADDCTNMQLQAGQQIVDLSSNLISPFFNVSANTTPGGCNFFITFDYGHASSYSTRSLIMGEYRWPFQMAKNSNGSWILKDYPDVLNNLDVLTGSLASGNSKALATIPYWVLVDMSNPWLRGGNYLELITAHLYKGTVSNATLVTSQGVLFYYNSAKRTDISIVSSGGAFNINDTTETMNFGTLSTGAQRTCDVVIKYNAGYSLYASSTNNGRLKHQTASQYIPYTMSFKGTNVNLSGSATSPVLVSTSGGLSPESGLVFPVVATIGSIGVTQSGSYSDTVTLTMQSTE